MEATPHAMILTPLRLVVFALTTAAAYALVTDYFFFADASYFLISILADNSLEGVWDQFPSRIGAFVLTQAPAIGLSEMAAPKALIKIAYSADFLLFPLACAALASKIHPGRETIISGTIVAGICCFSTFGFPTETTIAASLVFLLTSAITTPITDGKTAVVTKVMIFLVPPLLVFSHEAALVAMPSLIFVVAMTHKRNSPPRNFDRTSLLTYFVALMILWIFVKVTFEPSNPMVARALHGNRGTIVGVRSTLSRPIASMAFLGTATVCAVMLATGKSKPILVAVTAGAMSFLVYRAWQIDLPNDRYTARTVVIWLMPLIPFLPKITKRSTRSSSALICLTVLAIFIINMRSIYFWNEYKSDLASSLRGTRGTTRSDSSQARLATFRWDWALPYVSATITSKSERKYIEVDPHAWYSPLSCKSMRPDTRFDKIFSTEEISLLKEGVRQRLNC